MDRDGSFSSNRRVCHVIRESSSKMSLNVPLAPRGPLRQSGHGSKRRMKITPPDSHFLSAAVGWLELGNPGEAKDELARIAPDLQTHPEVLAVRWGIHYRAQEYEDCLRVAQEFAEIDPDNVQSWVDLSISQYKLGETQQAYNTLHSRLPKFNSEWAFYYNLACYAVQLGRHGEGKELIDRAILYGNEKEIVQIALNDPDLEPIQELIRKR